MKIPKGKELVAQVLTAVFVLAVCGAALFIALGIRSPTVQLGLGLSVLGLVFLIGLRIGGRGPGE